MSRRDDFTAVILGFGHSGNTLHLRCMRKLMATHLQARVAERVEVVDPFIARPSLGANVGFHRNLPPTEAFPHTTPVLHICTPPDCHLGDVRAALAAGYKYIIVEKPLAPSAEEARMIEQLAQRGAAELLVVAVWSNSSLTQALSDLTMRAGDDAVCAIEVVHNKARFSRTFARQNEHIFDIEMPHQMSVVLPFMGDGVVLLSAQTSDLMINGSCRSTMGRGEIVLAAPCGVRARLVSSLSHPVRERSIMIQLRGGSRLVGNFPVSGDDSYSQLSVYSYQNQLICHEIFDDDPLTNCLKNYYEYFFKCRDGRGAAVPNGAALRFNVQVVALLDEAKREQANYPIHMMQRKTPPAARPSPASSDSTNQQAPLPRGEIERSFF
ncbi:Gfo/Idh/MocA family oxidoreductase [Rugamonas sp. CCM 8940]|uniref:Gfo/Idh/MocA family oxidoreductase n=1 Tax=Rugamonas sp. CCM 8940 TaxID=2765359 RepID=UPI0018F75EC2|nr:Gfo/Idh/MocA family oxidoreductase [Rugamonas sp. CCM 8940]MBJ7311273.1 Gfo/Idh/MocA family oxidoreductase [Rugamonas sp. CCM 8940]